jgi:phosphate transport system substrate-binding protein
MLSTLTHRRSRLFATAAAQPGRRQLLPYGAVLLLLWPVAGLCAAQDAAQETAAAAAEFPAYAPARELAGDLELTVSGVTQPVAERLTEALRERQPDLNVELHVNARTGMESWWQQNVAPRAALLTQPMTNLDRAAFEATVGYPPTRLRVGSNALAVIVNPLNPVAQRGLTLAELDAMFSATGLRAHAGLHKWGQLGLGDEWTQRSIVPIAQTVTSALSQHFREQVMREGDFRPAIVRLEGSAAVVRRVGRDPAAIGYVAFSQIDDTVSVVGLTSSEADDRLMRPQPSMAETTYPLRYPLFLYVRHQPGSRVDPRIEALLRFIYSREGRQALAGADYSAVSADIAATDLRQLDLELR